MVLVLSLMVWSTGMRMVLREVRPVANETLHEPHFSFTSLQKPVSLTTIQCPSLRQ